MSGTVITAGAAFDPDDLTAAMELADALGMAWGIVLEYEFAEEVFEFAKDGTAPYAPPHDWPSGAEGVVYRRGNRVVVDLWSGKDRGTTLDTDSLLDAVTAIGALRALRRVPRMGAR